MTEKIQKPKLEYGYRTQRNKRCTYQKISKEMREEIVDRLVFRKEGLRDVAAEMGINHSTCKAIVKVFQEEGRIGKKKTRERNIQVIQTLAVCFVDRENLSFGKEIQVSEKKVHTRKDTDLNNILAQEAKINGKEAVEQMLLERKRISQLWTQPLSTQPPPLYYGYVQPQLIFNGQCYQPSFVPQVQQTIISEF